MLCSPVHIKMHCFHDSGQKECIFIRLSKCIFIHNVLCKYIFMETKRNRSMERIVTQSAKDRFTNNN